MSSYTSLAFGFLIAVVTGACGSSEDSSAPGAPPFSGPLAPAAGSSSDSNGSVPPGSPSDDTRPSASTDTPAAVDPANPPTGAANEGGPDVTQLDPSTPAPSDGTGGTGADPGGTAGTASTEPTPPVETENPPPVASKTQVFLLFGQSNMWGVPAPQAEDLTINPRVEVLTLDACATQGANQWLPAQPPLHGCVGHPSGGGQGPGLGMGDYFAKTVAEAFPNDTILLVPNAIPGVSIDVFQPGQQAYNSIVSRARMAQQRGEITGMIFHQGETDSGQSNWPTRVKRVVDQLRTDLEIGEVPLVAGELLYGGCCQGHNVYINQLPGIITNTSVARADGFTAVPQALDTFGNLHFDRNSQVEFGRRYAALMIDALTP
jgi:carbohydrate esterase-like sialic acid-specific acetylesterase